MTNDATFRRAEAATASEDAASRPSRPMLAPTSWLRAGAYSAAAAVFCFVAASLILWLLAAVGRLATAPGDSLLVLPLTGLSMAFGFLGAATGIELWRSSSYEGWLPWAKWVCVVALALPVSFLGVVAIWVAFGVGSLPTGFVGGIGAISSSWGVNLFIRLVLGVGLVLLGLRLLGNQFGVPTVLVLAVLVLSAVLIHGYYVEVEATAVTGFGTDPDTDPTGTLWTQPVLLLALGALWVLRPTPQPGQGRRWLAAIRYYGGAVLASFGLMFLAHAGSVMGLVLAS